MGDADQGAAAAAAAAAPAPAPAMPAAAAGGGSGPGPQPAAVPAAGRIAGVVKRWMANGYGFVQPADDQTGTGNLFCHFTDITDGNMLEIGATIEFEKQWNDQKQQFQAKNVTGGLVH